MKHKNKKHPYWQVLMVHGTEHSFESKMEGLMSGLMLAYNMHYEENVPTYVQVAKTVLPSFKIVCPTLTKEQKVILYDLGFTVVKEKLGKNYLKVHYTKFNKHNNPMDAQFKFSRTVAMDYVDPMRGKSSGKLSKIKIEAYAFIIKNCLDDVPRRYEKKAIELIEKGIIDEDGIIDWDIYHEVFGEEHQKVN